MESYPDYETRHIDKVGNLYRAVGGQELRNVWEKRPQFRTHGIQKPLAAASKITAKGNRIVLDDEDSLGYIENKAIGTKIPLKAENGVYVMEVAVTLGKTPFRRPAK